MQTAALLAARELALYTWCTCLATSASELMQGLVTSLRRTRAGCSSEALKTVLPDS